MKIIHYQAVWIDQSGSCFRVVNSCADSHDEAIQKCKAHTSIKAGAKLHYMDSWEAKTDLSR